VTNHYDKRDTSWVPQARELLEQDLSYTQVGEIVNRHRRTVSRHIPGYAQVPDLSWVPRAKELLEERQTYEAVGDAVGKSADAVARHLPGYGRYSQRWHDKALEMLEDGQSYREVGRTLDIDHGAIRRAFPGYGFTTEETQMIRQANALLNKTFPLGLDPNDKRQATAPIWMDAQ
jgi:hypothetical protein